MDTVVRVADSVAPPMRDGRGIGLIVLRPTLHQAERGSGQAVVSWGLLQAAAWSRLASISGQQLLDSTESSHAPMTRRAAGGLRYARQRDAYEIPQNIGLVVRRVAVQRNDAGGTQWELNDARY